MSLAVDEPILNNPFEEPKERLSTIMVAMEHGI